MTATLVKPPSIAAAEPVAIVSLSSRPGSRKWTCISMRPGQATRPRASRVSGAEALILPILRIRPSSTRMSTGAPVSQDFAFRINMDVSPAKEG
jgi:hypothetical protein